ncbi:MAG: hypothetical protein NTW52_13755 [Planctomycetota bacterium]|nr:hypothetical protein [Planctomycetota bacterium]
MDCPSVEQNDEPKFRFYFLVGHDVGDGFVSRRQQAQTAMLEVARMRAHEVVPPTPIAPWGSLPKRLVDKCASDSLVKLRSAADRTVQ